MTDAQRKAVFEVLTVDFSILQTTDTLRLQLEQMVRDDLDRLEPIIDRMISDAKIEVLLGIGAKEVIVIRSYDET